MAKSSFKKIELDKKKVIVELQKDARRSIDEIADTCGFSRQKVWRIIKRLEKDKIIWGYTTIVDEEEQGFKDFIILIKRTPMPLDTKLANRIITRQLEELTKKTGVIIEHSVYVNGIFDWFIYFKAEDLKQAKKFSENLITFYKGYIAEINILESLFPIRKQGILNPEIGKLKEFV